MFKSSFKSPEKIMGSYARKKRVVSSANSFQLDRKSSDRSWTYIETTMVELRILKGILL